ncbi:MAG: hypothetical protein AAGH15_23190 [Myxococcota bacterium]
MRRSSDRPRPDQWVRVGLLLLVGCTRTLVLDADDAGLGAADAGVADAGADGGAPDVGVDLGRDLGRDFGLDAGRDLGVDLGVDAGLDLGVDAGAACAVPLVPSVGGAFATGEGTVETLGDEGITVLLSAGGTLLYRWFGELPDLVRGERVSVTRDGFWSDLETADGRLGLRAFLGFDFGFRDAIPPMPGGPPLGFIDGCTFVQPAGECSPELEVRVLHLLVGDTELAAGERVLLPTPGGGVEVIHGGGYVSPHASTETCVTEGRYTQAILGVIRRGAG